jgi:hypothetical protein
MSTDMANKYGVMGGKGQGAGVKECDAPRGALHLAD